MDQLETRDAIENAARAIKEFEAIIILAGAGMGVDSGLPDFRGKEGFWKAYPMFKSNSRDFYDMASSRNFETNPALAWGFYGHRLNLYRETVPHDGFSLLKQWAENKPGGYFIYTSNVDGQFQKAGFDEGRIVECHGSIHHLQAFSGAKSEIMSSDGFHVDVDLDTMKAKNLPRHPETKELLRPNILMFDDWFWVEDRCRQQKIKYQAWLSGLKSNYQEVVLIELGAGSAIPTVKQQSLMLRERYNATLIKINPEGCHLADIVLKMGALEGLTKINDLIEAG